MRTIDKVTLIPFFAMCTVIAILAPFFSVSDEDVCPSDAEVMPFSILEAMASALPVIAHDIAGHHEQVVDNENGILVQSQDIPEYADAVEKVLADYERFSRASRKRAEGVFAMIHYADAMRETF